MTIMNSAMNNSVLFDSFAQKSSQFAVERLTFTTHGRTVVRGTDHRDLGIYQVADFLDDLGYYNFISDDEEVVEYGSKKMIVLDFGDVESSERVGELAEMLLFVSDDDVVTYAVNPITGTSNTFVSLITNQPVPMPIGSRRFGGNYGYGGQIVTANGLKDRVMICLENSDPAAVMANQDNVDFGLMRLHLGKKMRIQKAAKLALRMSNWMNVLHGTDVVIGELAIYFGEFANGCIDGNCYVSGSGCYQGRAFTGKYVANGLTIKDVEHKISFIDADPIVMEAAALSEDDIVEICDVIDAKGKGTKYAGRVVRIKYNTGKVNAPILFVDMNTLKAGFDVSRQSGLNVLHEFGKTLTRGYVRMTGQTAIKQALNDREKMMSFYKKTHLEQAIELFSFKSNVLPSANLMQNEGTVQLAAAMLDDDFETKYPFHVAKLVNKKLNSDAEMCNEFRVRVPGFSRVVLFDPTAFYGKRVIRAHEYYANGKDGVEAVVVKHPAFGSNETDTITGIKKAVMMARIDDIDLPREIREDIKMEIERAAEDAIFVGSWSVYKALLAGFDGDGDKFENMLNSEELGMPEQGIAIVIESADKPEDRHEVTITPDIMATMAAMVWRFDNASIGAVTTLFHGFQRMELNEDIRRFRKMAKAAFGNNGKGTKDYATILKVEGVGSAYPFIRVSEDSVNAIFGQIPDMRLDKENIMACLHDINNGVGRYYYERTIDASKKFDHVVLPGGYAMKSIVTTSYKSNTELVIDAKTGNVSVKCKGGKVDIMHATSIAMAEQSAAIVSEKLKAAIEQPECLEESQAKYCRSCWALLDADVQKAVFSVIQDTYSIKDMYGKMSNKKGKDSQKTANTFYATFYGLASNELRKILSLETVLAQPAMQQQLASFGDDEVARQDFIVKVEEGLPEFRIGVLFGGYFAGTLKGAIKQIGSGLLPQEFLAFVAKFSGKEGAVEAVKAADFGFSADYGRSLLHIHLGLNNEAAGRLVKTEKRIKKLVDSVIVGTTVSGKSIVLTGNGAAVKGLYVNTGKSELRKSLLDINGRVCALSAGVDSYGPYVLFGLCDVSANAHDEAIEAATKQLQK